MAMDWLEPSNTIEFGPNRFKGGSCKIQRLSQRGFSLVELIVAAGVFGVVVLGSSQTIISSIRAGTEAEKIFWIVTRRIEFQSAVRSPQGWAAIELANANMACFAAGTTCAAFTAPQPLAITISGSALSGSNAGLGMNDRGDFCTSYDALNSNPACPVGLVLQWQALCDDANCIRAQPKVTVGFRSPNINKSYDLAIFKDPKLDTLNDVCTSMGGTLVGMVCTVPQLATACNPGAGSFVLGFDVTGAVICGRPNPGSCAVGDIAIGFNASGGTQCTPACP